MKYSARRLMFVALGMIGLATTLRAGITVEASNSHPAVDEPITIVLTVTGATGPLILEPLPELEGLEMRVAGTPGRRLIVRDGKVQIEDYLILELIPHRAGVLELSGISIAAGDDTWLAPPVKITVGLPRAPALSGNPLTPLGAPALRILAEASPHHGYVGEALAVTYTLLGTGPVLRCLPAAPLEFPGFSVYSLPVGALAQPGSGSIRQIDGKAWRAWPLSRHLLTAVSPGPKLIPARQFRVALRDGERLGPEFMVEAPALRLEILAPPAGRAPAGYEGLVGDFLFTATLSPAQLAPGDYGELKLILKGRGGPFGAHPRLAVPPGLELRPPRENDLPAPPGELHREWIYPVFAGQEGRYRIGPATLAVFSPAQGDYEILSTSPLALAVGTKLTAVAEPPRPLLPPLPGRRKLLLAAVAGLALLLGGGLLQALYFSPAGRALRAAPADGASPEQLALWLRGALNHYLPQSLHGAPLPLQAERVAGPAARNLCEQLERARFASTQPPELSHLKKMLARCRWKRTAA